MQSNEFALWFICSVIQWICKPMCGQTSKLPEEGVAGINWSTNFHLLASIARRALVPWGKKGQCPMFPLVNQETNIPKRTVTGSCLAWCPVCGNVCLCLNSAETRCMQGERAGMEVLVIYYNADGETRKRDQTGCQFCVFLLARWGKEGRRVLRLTHIFSS